MNKTNQYMINVTDGEMKTDAIGKDSPGVGRYDT